MGIGSRIRERREELGLKQVDLAKRVKIAVSTLSDLENERHHRSTKLHQLCKQLGLNPDWVESGRQPRLASEPVGPSQIKEERERYQVHGLDATPEEVEMGIEWGKLDEPARSMIRQQVYLLVADQVRRKRAKKRDPDHDRPGHAGG